MNVKSDDGFLYIEFVSFNGINSITLDISQISGVSRTINDYLYLVMVHGKNEDVKIPINSSGLVTPLVRAMGDELFDRVRHELKRKKK